MSLRPLNGGRLGATALWACLLSACALAPPARAVAESAATYTLTNLVERALEHSAEVQESRWQLEGARSQVTRARAAAILPRLRLETYGGLTPDAKGSYLAVSSDTSGLRPLGPFARAELEFAQPLYTFGMLTSLRRAAESGEQVERARLADRRLEVALEVKEYYYGVLVAEDLLTLVRRFADELQEWEADVDPYDPDVPVSAPYKLGLAQLELERRERELESRLQLARAALAWKTGLPEDAPLELADDGLRVEPAAVPPLDSLEAMALRRRPDWAQLRSGIAARQAQTDAARSAYYPQIFVAGGLRYAVAPNRTDQHNPFVKDEYNYFNGGVFLGLRQSFEWGLLGADLQQARARLYELKARERTAAQGIRLDVGRAHGEFRQAQHRLKAARQGRSLGREWLQIAQEEYELDPGQLKELVGAFERLAVLEQEYREAVYHHNTRLARLERTVGLELGLRPGGDQ